jgi:hypothetical protein
VSGPGRVTGPVADRLASDRAAVTKLVTGELGHRPEVTLSIARMNWFLHACLAARVFAPL